MKFKLTTSAYFYKDEDKAKLETLGFAFTPTKENYERVFGQWRRRGDSSIDINTLEELIAFIREWGCVVVDERGIEIYDDYRE